MTPVAEELVVPAGWLVDPVTRDRLTERLAASGPDVVGVAAPVAPLLPGTSYRVMAEWAALEDDEATPAPDGPLAAAVLLRPGAEHTVGPGGVTVAGGAVLVDPRARAHDPDAEPGPVDDAVERGRPPFPCRLVVVLLSSDGDPDRAAWAGRVADALLALDVEARVASSCPAATTRLTRACRPTAASLMALRPDVVLALDAAAVDQAEAWCAELRATVVVALDDEVDGIELVPWRLDVARGRLRSRVGPEVEPVELARLVNRLASGPLPGPPVDHDQPVSIGGSARRRARPAAAVAAVLAAEDAASAERYESLIELWVDAELEVLRLGPDDLADAAFDAEGLLVVGASGSAALTTVVQERSAAGRSTLVEVRPVDLAERPDDPDGAWSSELVPEADALVSAAGRALFASRGLRDRVDLGPVRRLVLSTPLHLAEARRVAGLRAARARRDRPVVLGWHLAGWAAGRSPAAGAWREAVAEALLVVLDRHPGSRLELTGLSHQLPVACFDDQRVSVRGGADIDTLDGWSLMVDALDPDDVLAGRWSHLVRATALGVPVVQASPVDPGEPWFVPAAQLGGDGDDPDVWAAVVGEVLDGDPARQAARTDEARGLAADLIDPDAIVAVVRSLHQRVRTGR
jgi:hypothetical protein